MFGLLIAAISFVLFVVGFLVGTLLVIAVRINLEDRAALKRLDGSILLHEEPEGSAARRVRRLWSASATARGNSPGSRRRQDL